MTLPFAQLSFPEMYERELVDPLFRPWAELIVEDLAFAPGDRVLDIACGTGIVARLAKRRVGEQGTVVGVDLSPAMLAVARRVAPDVDWREGDAAALPLRNDEQFDAVVCQQGLQFFPEKTAAVREMRRALAADGRLVVSTWRSDEQLPFLRELRRVAERHLGPIADRRHSFGDGHRVEELLSDAGFREVRSTTVSRTIRFADGSVFARLNAMALVGMAPVSKDMGDEERRRILEVIVRDSAAVTARHTDERGLAFELSANIATARG